VQLYVIVGSMCSIDCSWLLRRSRACVQSQMPYLTYLIGKFAHLVVSTHISLQVKHLTQVG